MPGELDLIVLGSGPGGYVAAIRAAQLGMRTVVVERGGIGGRCLNVACIPAKVLLRAADSVSEIQNAGDHGILVDAPRVDAAALSARRSKVIGTLTRGVSGLLRKHGVEVIRGTGRIAGVGSVVVEGLDAATLDARNIILATGSVPTGIPDIERGVRIIGTEEAWALEEVPARLAIVGAGSSGVELASAYGRLGSQVLLIEAQERILPAEDPEIAALVQRAFEQQGIEVRTGVTVAGVVGDERDVGFSLGGQRFTVDWFVIAAGRRPDIDALGVTDEELQLDQRGRVLVDELLRTSLEGVSAIGDLVPGPALAHKASAEGLLAVEAMAGLPVEPLVHHDIPRATFCSPSVASVGLTEEQARASGHEVVVGRAPFSAVGAGAIAGAGASLVKLVGDRRYGELLGAHLVGPRSTELLQSIVNAQQLEGGFPDLARIVHAHPTLSEAIAEAARDADGWIIHG